MKHKYKHIHFVQAEDFQKKQHWVCRNNKGYEVLADVFYYKPWKKFTTRFNEDSVFDESCLRDIASFLDQLSDVKE